MTPAETKSADFISRTRRRRLILSALLLTDTVTLLLASTSAAFIRFGTVSAHVAIAELGPNISYFDLALVMTPIWLVTLWLERLYDLDRVFWGTAEYSRVIRALSVGVVVFILITFTLNMPGLSRAWTVLAWVLACVLVISGRAAVRAVVASARRSGHMLRRTLVVGYNAEADDIIHALAKNTSSGLVPVGCLASSKNDREQMDLCNPDVPCMGAAGEIREVLAQHPEIDTVLIASTAFDHDIVARIINELRGKPVDIQLSSGLLDVTTQRVLVREVSGIPLITIKGVGFTPAKRVTKRVFDLLVATASAIILSPLWLLIILAILVDDRGPVLYTQERVGRDGKRFRMYKFRSMRVQAEEQLAEVKAANEATGPLFKMKADPRVTRVGRILRRTSLDEFPQLINVLKGEMSLVGPRPPLPAEVEQYSREDWRRLEVLPGMTGLWQVSGRSTLTFAEMVHLDLFYIENWSVGFDLSLMMRTIPAVVLSRGAY